MNHQWLIVCTLIFTATEVLSFRCDRRPYGSTTQSSAPDGRFKLVVLNAGDSYMPKQLYTVQITATDDVSRFVSFIISAEGDLKPDPRNLRRLISMSPGEIRPQSPDTARFSVRCKDSVEQTIANLKSSVEVHWQAPPSGNGCVILRAMVAENDAMWYEDGAPLTQKLCEDLRQPDDVSPQLNYECEICDEAKYEISFTGIWSRNTHPALYPENDWIPRYSDLVGVSHAADFILWAPGSLATPGLRDLAEYANSSKLEAEMREKIGDGVRTLIKGKGHGYRKMNNPTYAFFRVDKTNHLVTAAVGLYPSPDWFLGMSRFELCMQDKTWLPERELNLYPWDAGTDSGVSYESGNIPTFPPDIVARVQMSSYDKNSPFFELDMTDMHPFGKLHIKLIRTYHRECEEGGENTPEKLDGGEPSEDGAESSEDGADSSEDGAEPSEPEEPSRYQNLDGDHGRKTPIVVDPDSTKDCLVTDWQPWSLCDGPCEDGKMRGYKWRQRYHLVDGIPVEKYDPKIKPSSRKEVSDSCKEKYNTFEETKCEESCSEDITVERRIMTPISPGHAWIAKKREISKPEY